MDHGVEVLPSIRTKEKDEWKSRQIPSRMPSRIAQIRLVNGHPEVYEPCDDSFALVDALLADRKNLLEHQPMFCMEVGCGSGYVITSLAIMLMQEDSAASVSYFATDINPHAVRVTSETLKAHTVHAEVLCDNIASSGLEKRLWGKVDVMVVNPPYVPTPEDEVGRDGIASAWAGGENGRTVIDKILPVADKLLSNKGWLYMVTLAANNPSQICLVMKEKGYASRIIVQRSTEEESLHVIKFWRDPDLQVGEPKDRSVATMQRTSSAGLTDSIFLQFPRMPFWRNGNSSTS
ncbi:hypothetical protein C5167_039797 [Papaver somniferum]|uniref:Methyltransferase small domain-containing protein n=1 Tax=Papaver somniferum TaxID=3469 RepID=A0A4Y7IDB7_PAPSO|nr:hemK methyltransferase family member 2-like [Papaver somniferum]XP_026415427.1 hemK methyltransferase family member 2-like [Papaver somniferum]XP_026415435.1 hemK methyltransferase family member 2-like [Papaver somniferum]XP_026415438.1 hemK methyltransferase family member 2-like [Papaver somniferum]XP_026415447.1 hemK methyltransferase family member 2-like [Papaver somniferum]RZC46844.1 hypothetical protein C5167_039797 [Papaver somniferum]